jgi:hypothetical protein
MSKRAAPQARGKPRSGGGLTSNKLVRPKYRSGPARTNVVSVQSVAEQGMSINWPRQPLVKGTAGQVPLGNQTSAEIKCGPGGGRTIYPRGTEDQHGKPSYGEGDIGPNAGKDILSAYGPDKSEGKR